MSIFTWLPDGALPMIFFPSAETLGSTNRALVLACCPSLLAVKTATVPSLKLSDNAKFPWASVCTTFGVGWLGS